MPKASQISSLTTKVYGPYYDHFLFKNTYPKDGVTLEVTDLQMYCNNRVIGFDATEFIGSPPEGSIRAKNEKVVIFAVYKIPSLDCLSEKALEYLQRDLREYDEEIHVGRSGLTLQTLYGDKTWVGSRIRVRVACNMTLSAHFLTSKNDPEKLILYSTFEGKQRRLWVQSLHASTFSLSRNFFDRYRLRALIEQLIDTDRDNTPLENRTIDWLIERYLAEIHPRDAHNRIIADPNPESDISSEPRHLNHLPRARIRHYFAAQAEWLLAHMIATSSKQVKLLNIEQWIRFCRQSHNDSIEARKNGVRWGVPHGAGNQSNGSYDLCHNMAKFGHDYAFWKRKLHIINQRKKDKAADRRLSPEIRPDASPTPLERQFQYDSDFSEPSTAGESDTDPVKPPFVQKIPNFCLEVPRIPEGRFSWACLCQECEYNIDLLNLSPENLNILSPDLIQVLNTKTWVVNDEPVQRALLVLVSNHYESHLRDSNVQLSQSPSGDWLAQTLQVPKRQNNIAIKKEDSVAIPDPQLRRSGRKSRLQKAD